MKKQAWCGRKYVFVAFTIYAIDLSTTFECLILYADIV